MAGSYNHVTTDDGNLVGNEYFPNVIENLGDAYEMAEEMYGMIWWLAAHEASTAGTTAKTQIQRARQNYQRGLELARQENIGG